MSESSPTGREKVPTPVHRAVMGPADSCLRSCRIVRFQRNAGNAAAAAGAAAEPRPQDVHATEHPAMEHGARSWRRREISRFRASHLSLGIGGRTAPLRERQRVVYGAPQTFDVTDPVKCVTCRRFWRRSSVFAAGRSHASPGRFPDRLFQTVLGAPSFATAPALVGRRRIAAPASLSAITRSYRVCRLSQNCGSTPNQ